MRKVVGWLGVAIIVAVFIGGFLAYFLTSFDPRTRVMSDGFGRPLSESPLLMRLAFGQERLWAGWFWFLADMAIFWGGIVAGFKLASWGLQQTSNHGAAGGVRE